MFRRGYSRMVQPMASLVPVLCSLAPRSCSRSTAQLERETVADDEVRGDIAPRERDRGRGEVDADHVVAMRDEPLRRLAAATAEIERARPRRGEPRREKAIERDIRVGDLARALCQRSDC